VFRDSDAESIQIIGGAASYNASSSELVVANNVIDGSGMVDSVPCIEVGSSAGYMQNIIINGNQITSANSDAIKVYARYGSITGNTAYGAGGDGLDLTSSENLTVTGNNFSGAGAYGIDGSSSTDCVVSNNLLSGATTDAVNLGGTRLRQYHNVGGVGAPPPNTFSTTNASLTLPAGTLQIGDQINLDAYFDASAAGGAGSVRIYLNGQEIGRTASNASTAPRMIRSVIEVTGSTTAEYFAYGCISADGLLVTHSNTVSGLDLTSDMNFTVTNTNLTRSYIKYVVALSSREDG
jgi:parallel beta-helix repeat protein